MFSIPDQQFKSMGLLAAAGQDSTELFLLGDRLLIQPALRWQMLAFSLESLTAVEKRASHRLVFLWKTSAAKALCIWIIFSLFGPEFLFLT